MDDLEHQDLLDQREDDRYVTFTYKIGPFHKLQGNEEFKRDVEKIGQMIGRDTIEMYHYLDHARRA